MATETRSGLSTAQVRFLDSKALYRGFVGGRGAGKSHTLTYDLLCRGKPNRFYAVVTPTYPILRDSTLRSFHDNVRRLGIRCHFNKNEMIATVGGGRDRFQVAFRSADNPETLRGPNLSGACIDEASLTDRATFDVLIACLREGGEQGWLSAAFTPKGKQHWTYEVFGTGRPDTELVHAPTRDNPFLPPEFETTLRRQYTSFYAEQELEGAFLDPLGLMFAVGRIQTVEIAPARASRVRYFDKAGTDAKEREDADFTAGVLMSRDSDGIFTVEDVVAGQWSSLVRNQYIRSCVEQDRRKLGMIQIWVEQEPGSGGKESAEITVRELAGYDVHAERVTGKLPARALPFAAQVEAGNVRIVRAPWNAAFIDELAIFPQGKHDDQVAAACGAFNKLCALPGEAKPSFTRMPGPTKEYPPGHMPGFGAGGWGRDYAAENNIFGVGNTGGR